MVIEFKTSNDAFANGNGREEVSRILEDIAQKVCDGLNSGIIRDINGNQVGWWRV